MNTYRELNVWKKSMDLAASVYALVQVFPKEETYGLTSQLRRAVVSMPANIAEGYGRNSTRDYIKHLRYAAASGFEVQTLLEISLRVGYAEEVAAIQLIRQSEDIGRMLSTMIRKIAEHSRT